MISGAAADPSCPQASDLPDKSMISYQKGEKDIMKNRQSAVLSAAFMTMVSGLPAYAASNGWVTEEMRRSITMKTGTSPPMRGESAGRLVLSW